ncbi:hypothetical protein JK358_34325 [Nocardia sp. 2]|uniref:Uncharacterized protein n=1 Tax=Nocardia acididurans TaxID=2802282 RepID=A0ABS1MHF3_9NOCA|nr:hypothetical protein [Nocardia acididurans]MBL1079495.1 hypothetical protein [Nocardia acididurans]
MSDSRDCLACEGQGYQVSDEGTYEPEIHIYPCSVCDGSGIEPPAAVKIEAQAAFEKNETTMRTDFARVKALLAESRTSGWHWSIECAERANHIESAWKASDRAADWDYLDRAHFEWDQFPDTMQGLFQHLHKARSDTGVCPLTEMQWRSQEQARDLTGHGRQQEPQQVNAFAAAAAGAEREGTER